MTSLIYDNIFKAVTENQDQAKVLQARADLIILIRDIVNHLRWSQSEIAIKLSLTHSRVRELLDGKIDKLPIDLLVSYLYILVLYLKPID